MKDINQERYRELGKRIAYYREKRGLSQAELAARIHCSKDFIRKIEAFDSDNLSLTKSPLVGKSLDILFAIADSLELDWIIFFQPSNEENYAKYRMDK
jgi:transcriptional regulator with XRE-family HTH domain